MASDIVLTVGWLILGFCGCVCLGPLCIDAMRLEPGRINDFFQDWASARNFVVGLPVYTHHTISVSKHLGLPSNPVEGIEYNAHPPTMVLLALPLAQLDYAGAVFLWNTLSSLLFLASLGIVAAALPVPRRWFLPCLALLTFCHPVYGNLYQGQLSLVLTLFVTTVWALERSGRANAAGLVLGIAAAVKLFPAYLAVYFAAQKRYRALLTAALSFAILAALAALVLGPAAYGDYVRVVLPRQAKFQSFGNNLSIAGFWYKLFDPVGERGWMTPLWPSPALARYGTLVSNLAITVVVVMASYRARTSVQRDLAFASVVSATLLVSPVTWDTSLPLLLVPFAVIARVTGPSRWMLAALIGILVVVWAPQQLMIKLALGGRSLRVASWAFMLGAPSLKSYALLGLFALGLVAFRANKEENGTAGLGCARAALYNEGTLSPRETMRKKAAPGVSA